VERYELVGKGIVLKAAPARSPKVVVTDVYGKPIGGVKVSMQVIYGLVKVTKPVGVTNSAGEVIVPSLYKGGQYAFRATLLGYCPMSNTPPPVRSENWIDLIEMTMGPATDVVKGKVVDGNGKPVSGAKVTTDFGPSALTDGTGEFTLKQMPDSPVPIKAGKGKLSGTNVDAKGRIPQRSETVIVVR
jgi:hypothetical protein